MSGSRCGDRISPTTCVNTTQSHNCAGVQLRKSNQSFFIMRGYKRRGSTSNSARVRRARANARKAFRASIVGRRRGASTYRSKRRLRLYRNPLAQVSTRTMLKYHQIIFLNPSDTDLPSTGVHHFSINNMYDPDVKGVGHQPLYFDQYTQVYRKFRVNFARISVTAVNHIVNTTVVSNYSYRLFILNEATEGTTSEYPNDIDQIIEEGGPNIKWRYVGPSLTGKLPRLKATASPHRLMNLPFKDDRLAGTSSAGPTNQCFFIVGAASADGVQDSPGIYLAVTITYWCEFWDRVSNQTAN